VAEALFTSDVSILALKDAAAGLDLEADGTLEVLSQLVL
jgi:hypothetical protein